MTEQEHIGQMVLKLAKLSDHNYILIRRGLIRYKVDGTKEWRVTIKRNQKDYISTDPFNLLKALDRALQHFM